MVEHFQGFPLSRFLTYLHPEDAVKCLNCSAVAIIPGKVRLMGGSYLAYRKKYKNDEAELQRWVDEPSIIQRTTHFPFQCMQCGKLHAVEHIQREGYHSTTESHCECGGVLSTAHPLFCNACSYNKELSFDSQRFISGQIALGEFYEQNPEEVLKALESLDIKEPPKHVPFYLDASSTAEYVSIEEPQKQDNNRFEIQYYLMEIFRPDEHQWRSKWQMLYSDKDLLALVDPEDPCTVILEVDYANLPLDESLPGQVEIRLISDDGQRHVLKSIIYQTPPIGAMEWVIDNLYDILERDWE
jgi:hypothetical protein